MKTEQALRLIRLPEVIERVGLSKPSLYRLMKENRFPAAKKLGKRAVAWLSTDIDKFIESREVA